MQYWQIFSSFLIFCCYFTRLKAREISCKMGETRKIFPILHSAPCDNNYLIILKCHVFVLHSGVKDTLNELRCNYWVTRGRQTVKFVTRKCLKCIRQSSRPFDVLPTAPLPSFREEIDFPYSHTGMDNLEPLYIRNIYGSKNGDLYKCHIVLYTCASTRMVSIDIVPDAS